MPSIAVSIGPKSYYRITACLTSTRRKGSNSPVWLNKVGYRSVLLRQIRENRPQVSDLFEKTCSTRAKPGARVKTSFWSTCTKTALEPGNPGPRLGRAGG